jgi:hypothetical protein
VGLADGVGWTDAGATVLLGAAELHEASSVAVATTTAAATIRRQVGWSVALDMGADHTRDLISSSAGQHGDWPANGVGSADADQ